MLVQLLQRVKNPPSSFFARLHFEPLNDSICGNQALFDVILYTSHQSTLHHALALLLDSAERDTRGDIQSVIVRSILNPCMSDSDMSTVLSHVSSSITDGSLYWEDNAMELASTLCQALEAQGINASIAQSIIDVVLQVAEKIPTAFSSSSRKVMFHLLKEILDEGKPTEAADKLSADIISILHKLGPKAGKQPWLLESSELQLLTDRIRKLRRRSGHQHYRERSMLKSLLQLVLWFVKNRPSPHSDGLEPESRTNAEKNVRVLLKKEGIKIFLPMLVPTEDDLVVVVLDITYELLQCDSEKVNQDKELRSKILLLLERIEQVQASTATNLGTSVAKAVKKIQELFHAQSHAPVKQTAAKIASLSPPKVRKVKADTRVVVRQVSVRAPKPKPVTKSPQKKLVSDNLLAKLKTAVVVLDKKEPEEDKTRMKAQSAVKEMLVEVGEANMDEIPLETATAVIQQLLESIHKDSNDHVALVSLSALGLLCANSKRNRAIVAETRVGTAVPPTQDQEEEGASDDTINGLECILQLLDTRYYLGILEAGLQCLHHFAKSVEYYDMMARSAGLRILMTFARSAHVAIRELALGSISRLVFFGGDDMRKERDLFVENSVWEKLCTKWEEDWDEDPHCMFKTSETSDLQPQGKKKRKK
ncbi:MAG: hypothetical protein SGCHY_003472 [Lobulomycetales sp.]